MATSGRQWEAHSRFYVWLKAKYFCSVTVQQEKQDFKQRFLKKKFIPLQATKSVLIFWGKPVKSKVFSLWKTKTNTHNILCTKEIVHVERITMEETVQNFQTRITDHNRCHKLSEMESGSWADCWKSGINLATPIYGDKPRSKLDDDFSNFSVS